MVHRSTLKTARTLLDRLFREAEGRTNHQLDVSFVLADLGLGRDKAEPGLDYLVSRGLLNSFGPEVAFLTEEGVQASVEDVDIGQLGPARSFGAAPPAAEVAPPPEPASSPDAPHLVHVRLDGETTIVPLGVRCEIGRASDSDVPVDDKRASKRHAEVRYERGSYVVEDLESANGTLLNGTYCVEPTRLSHDDEIVIGRTMLVYQGPDSFPPPPGANAPRSGPRVEPSGAPTERPSPAAPDLADPRIRVVRGTPARDGPSSSPAQLFVEPADTPPDDVFRAPSAETLGPGPLGLEPEPVHDDSPFELDLKEDLAAPDNDISSGLEFADEEPTSVADPDEEPLAPTLMPSHAPAEAPHPIEPLELSEVVDPLPAEGPVPSAIAEEEATATMTVDFGAEQLPVAPSGLPAEPPDWAGAVEPSEGLELPAEPEATLNKPFGLEEPPAPTDSLEDTPGAPRFLVTLDKLRAEVASVAGTGPSPLLDAIDLLAVHPLVRAFAEDEDPER